MRLRRRLTFQLTPLVDLLLIVIFAQFMDVRQTARLQAEASQKQQQALEREYARLRQELQTAQQAASAAIRTRQQELAEQFRSLSEQHRQVSRTLARTLRLPERLTDQVVRLRRQGRSDEAGDLEQAVRELRQRLEQRPEDLFRFFIQYDEMEKHVSVWELHLLENGQVLFTDGHTGRRISFASAEEFSRQCLEASKAFAEPRPLTLLLLTWNDAQAGFRRMAADGLPQLVQRLRNDSGGTRWFDYSLIGFRPAGPLLDAGKTVP